MSSAQIKWILAGVYASIGLLFAVCDLSALLGVLQR